MSKASLLVSASEIGLSLNGRAILQHISFSLKAEQIVTLIGPNGAGKTTLVRLVLGLLKPDTGSVTLKPGLRIGYMPQRIAIDHTIPITVKRFLQLACSTHKTARQPLPQNLLQEIGIEHILNAPLQSISGGEFQRVLLTRSLLNNPELLVLDEPVQGVDINGQETLYRLIRNIRERYHCGILMVSHDLHLVMAATDEVICLNQHICCTGHPESIRQHPEFLKLFGQSAGSFAVYAHHHDHQHDTCGNIVNAHPDTPT